MGKSLGKKNKVLAHLKCNHDKSRRIPTKDELFVKDCLYRGIDLITAIKLRNGKEVTRDMLKGKETDIARNLGLSRMGLWKLRKRTGWTR